ncbi:MAG TPA: protein kinase [Thermoanaerobaculia bacterium]
MALEPGTRLGPYEVSSPLGAGGMGEVYRARDPRLARDVAIKVLPEEFFEGEEKRARFEREARTLASLNHPGIAAIYSFEEIPAPFASSTRHILVMELVDGEDLAERLRRGAIPVDEALAIAKQIAEGLEAAHEKGIVHRDLKPANVKLTKDGVVKILDFGLAKAFEGDDAAATSASSLTQSPTMSRHLTEAGVILGTAAYMSPEQARGKPVDKRTDIWSFGVVLHEMLAGKRLFVGETVSDTLAAVLRQDLDLAALPAETPDRVRRLLARCLVRDPKLRLRDIGDARLELDAGGPGRPADVPAAPRRSPSLPLAIAAALGAAALAAAAVWTLKPAPAVPRHPLVRMSYPMGPQLGLMIQRRLLAIAPDGRTLATVVGSLGTGSHLEVRRLDELAPSRVKGSEGIQSVFFSPDSRFIGFTTDTAIKKVAIGSNEGVIVADIGTNLSSGPSGISWGDNGLIYFGTLDGIRAVPAAGGAAQMVVAGRKLAHPQVLPGSRFLLYARQSQTAFTPDGPVVLRSLGDGTETELTTGTSPICPAGDMLLVARADGVFAAPLSLAGRRLTKEPVLVVRAVALVGSAAQYDLSKTGTLVYMPGSVLNESLCLPRRVQATGLAAPLSKTVREYSDPRVSPDGRHLALHVQDEGDDVWAFDVARDSLTRLTFEPGEDETPVWSPDGRWIAFSATRGEKRCVIRRPADGSGAEEVLWTLSDHAHVTDWSPDGRSLLVDVYRVKSRSDILRLELGEKPTPHPFLETPFDESSGRVSPDGRWIAYRSNESGRDEVYLQPFPNGGGKVSISNGGGVQPVWARDGKALYFRSDTDLMVARLGAAPAPAFRPAISVFKDRFVRPQGAAHTTYDVFPDGSFFFLEPTSLPEGSAAPTRSVIAAFHWLENLETRVEAKP